MELIQLRTRISEIYGLLLAMGLIVYFVIAYFAGFVNIIELRFLNFPIILLVEYMALRRVKAADHGNLPYAWCLAVGIFSSLIGITIFAIFLFIAFESNHYLYTAVVTQSALGRYLSVFMAPMGVWMEGAISGVAAAFILANTIHTDPS